MRPLFQMIGWGVLNYVVDVLQYGIVPITIGVFGPVQ